MLKRVFITIFLVSVTKTCAQDNQQCSEHQFDIPFFPGNSCEYIYNKNLQSCDKSGYYWILDGPARVYCGMSNSGSSCEDVYVNNVEIRDKSGYYRINDKWAYCNKTAFAFSRGDLKSSCVGVIGGRSYGKG